MASRDDIINFCDAVLQIEKFKDYGPKGLQVIGKQEVKKIVSGVSSSLDLFQQASKRSADMVIVHHGEFWKNTSQVVDSIRKHRLQILFEHDITLLGYHLPLDAHTEIGNNALLVTKLGLTLSKEAFGVYEGQVIGALGEDSVGIGRDIFIRRINEQLDTKAVVLDFGTTRVKRVGIISGGGADGIREAYEKGCDTFVTGESKEYSYHLARELEMNVVFAGHYNSVNF